MLVAHHPSPTLCPLPLHAIRNKKKRKNDPGIFGHSLTNSFSAPRPQAAGIWQPRRVALFFIVVLLGFSAALLPVPGSLSVLAPPTYSVYPNRLVRHQFPRDAIGWPPNWHAWLKRLGAIITQITEGKGRSSSSPCRCRCRCWCWCRSRSHCLRHY